MSEWENNISKSSPVENNAANESSAMNGQLARVIKCGDYTECESLRMSGFNSSLQSTAHSDACVMMI